MDGNHFPVADLAERYKISRATVYADRLGAMKKSGLGEPYKRSGRSYVSIETQLKFLDNLNDYLLNGGTTEEFLSERYGESVPSNGNLVDIQNSSEKSLMLASFGAILQNLKSLENSQKSILSNYEELQKVCDHGWLLSSSKLCVLLELKRLNGDLIEKFGFRCTRIKTKYREDEWKIEKS
ncbi:MAG: hypothetical protein KME10_27980 [Plectolyngbya sp. WJT66-NPBG17]|jgi:hypothetical protein|nr:hypothetical protein [Plectolyngbya sp. WJT66-NPBG17]